MLLLMFTIISTGEQGQVFLSFKIKTNCEQGHVFLFSLNKNKMWHRNGGGGGITEVTKGRDFDA